MAVTTTWQDIIEIGYSKSTKNQLRQIANEEVELLGLAYRALSGLYSVAATFARTVFAVVSDPVAYEAPGWARPEDAENVFLAEMEDGTEVAILGFEDRKEALVDPAVYELGNVFRLAPNQSALEITDNLIFSYAKSPTQPSSLDDTLDALWKESYNELLGLEVALFLTLKDGREEEVALATRERNTWAKLFLSYLEHHTSAAISRHSGPQYTRSEMIQAIGQVLTPGSEALK